MSTVVSAQLAEQSAAPGPAREVRVPAPSAWWLLIGGVIGLLASIDITVEKIQLLLDASYVPSCDVNPIVSCGSVMASPQASVFGFPNPLIGIAAFSVVVVTGVLAVARVPLPQWYWIGLGVGLLAGAAFVHWLIFQSLYRIGALCPYCMVVWAATITLLVVLTTIVFRPVLENGSSTVARLFYQWRWSLATFWFTAVFLLIMVRFWSYWSTLI